MAVTIAQGTLVGLQHKTRYLNKPYISFLGVPYAKPPIDDLRFKPPVEHPGWTGELKAFSEGNKCLQCPIPELMSNEIGGSEDCLYLNIFVPQEEQNEKKAVMVFIHGGAFNNGSASVLEYSPDYLLNENVIVVTINYRLNVFGFLNFDIDECPGNMGLKDQRLALKWVKENISAFGGNAENITIFGESAGSASVHCHTISPQSAGLFQKAIMQSGCMLNSWAMNEKHREAAFRLAKHFECEENDPKNILKYLKTVSAMDLVKFSNVNSETDSFAEYPFLPSIESASISNPVLSTHPEILMKTASPLPIITGINDMEGILGFMEGPKVKKLVDFPTTEAISTFFDGRCSDEDVTKIKNFYFNDCNRECKTSRLENFVHLNSDVHFVKDFHRGFEYLLKQSVTPVYNYEFKFDGKINAYKNIILRTEPSIRQLLKGACHADELCYLFYAEMFQLAPEADSPELKMCVLMSKLWTNFAKTGNPNSPDISFEWKNTSLDEPNYLSIDGDNTKMVDGLLCGSRVKLWEDIKTV